MAEREQYLNADMAGQKERTERRVQQEGSERLEQRANRQPRDPMEQVAERNQEYREADQNATGNNPDNQNQSNERDLAWQMRQQQIAGTPAGGKPQAMAGTQDGQEGGEGGSTSRSSEAEGGNNRYSTGQ